MFAWQVLGEARIDARPAGKHFRGQNSLRARCMWPVVLTRRRGAHVARMQPGAVFREHRALHDDFEAVAVVRVPGQHATGRKIEHHHCRRVPGLLGSQAKDRIAEAHGFSADLGVPEFLGGDGKIGGVACRIGLYEFLPIYFRKLGRGVRLAFSITDREHSVYCVRAAERPRGNLIPILRYEAGIDADPI